MKKLLTSYARLTALLMILASCSNYTLLISSVTSPTDKHAIIDENIIIEDEVKLKLDEDKIKKVIVKGYDDSLMVVIDHYNILTYVEISDIDDLFLKRNEYETWITLKDKSKTVKGVLKEVRSTSIIVTTRYSDRWINISNIENIKFREKNIIPKTMLLGGALGFGVGMTGGLLSGDDPSYQYCGWFRRLPNCPYVPGDTAEEKGVENGLALGVIFSTVGGLAASKKTKLEINGSIEDYNVNKEKLRKYVALDKFQDQKQIEDVKNVHRKQHFKISTGAGFPTLFNFGFGYQKNRSRVGIQYGVILAEYNTNAFTISYNYHLGGYSTYSPLKPNFISLAYTYHYIWDPRQSDGYIDDSLWSLSIGRECNFSRSAGLDIKVGLWTPFEKRGDLIELFIFPAGEILFYYRI